MRHPFSRRDIPRVLLVGFATLVLGLFVYDLFTVASWQTTLQYNGDGLEVLARVKLAAEQGFGVWRGQPLDRLGAPFETSWATYAQPDQCIFWLAGKLSLLIGLIPTTHVLVLAAHFAAAVSFYLCARSLGHRSLWAASSAILFGLSHFNLYRGLIHYSFTLSFLIPVMLLVSWKLARSRRIQLTRSTAFTGFVIALSAGAGNPYYTFFFLQLLGGAFLFQVFTERRRPNLIAASVLIVATLASTLAWNWPTLHAQQQSGAADPLVRSYAGNELYALKFVELFVPPPSHHFPIFADFGRYYGGSTSLRGELFTSYLGLVPAAGLLLLLLAGLGRLLRSRAGLVPSHFPWTIWFLLTGSVGGVQAWLALAGLNYFRAGNRYSVVILAVSLYFLSGLFSRLHWLRDRRYLRIVLFVSVTALGLWDQIPPAASATARNAASKRIQDDTSFANFLETHLPAKTRIFQLPAVPFLEQPTMVGMTDYAEFRPFLFSRTLRFSYGSLVRSPEANWLRWVGSLPPADMIDMLQGSGFGAICINRRAYVDRAQALIEAFTAAGHPPEPDPTGNPVHVLIRIHPSTTTRKPDLNDTRLLKPWDPDKKNLPISVFATRGWLGFERYDDDAWRWAEHDAVVTILNRAPALENGVVRFEYASNKPGRLTLFSNGKSIWNAATSINQATAGNIAVQLPPGSSELRWVWEGRLVRPSTGDNRKLGFKIKNLQVSPTGR